MTRAQLWTRMPVDAVKGEELVERLQASLNSASPLTVAFSNAHMGYLYAHDERLRDALDRFDVISPDGWPIARGASKATGQTVNRLSGPEFLPHLFQAAVERKWRIAILAANDHAVVMQALQSKFPGLQVSFSAALPYYESPPSTQQVEDWLRTNPFDADVVLVGIGCPKQELFTDALAPLVKRPVLAVGQALQIAAGLRPKPPRAITRLGLEWAWRLTLEPKRLGRRYWQSGVFTVQTVLRQKRGKAT